MKLKIISSIALCVLAGFPSEIFAHTGSKAACYDMSDSYTFRTSGDFYREGDPIPFWKPGKKTGGGTRERQERCMHYGYERHKGPKGKKLTDLCHKHALRDTNRKIQSHFDPDGNRLGKHIWTNVNDLKRCRKTG